MDSDLLISFNAHVERHMIQSIGDALHKLHTETGSHIYAQVVLKNLGQQWQCLRGAGIKAETEIQKLYPARTPLCQMVWYADDYDPSSLQKAHGNIRKAIDKKQPTILDLKRKSVRAALLSLISHDVPSLSTRSTVPQKALQKNDIVMIGFSRVLKGPATAQQHWSHSESYNMEECETFLKAHQHRELRLEWGSGNSLLKQTTEVGTSDGSTCVDDLIEPPALEENTDYHFGPQEIDIRSLD